MGNDIPWWLKLLAATLFVSGFVHDIVHDGDQPTMPTSDGGTAPMRAQP